MPGWETKILQAVCPKEKKRIQLNLLTHPPRSAWDPTQTSLLTRLVSSLIFKYHQGLRESQELSLLFTVLDPTHLLRLVPSPAGSIFRLIPGTGDCSPPI